MTHKVCYVWLGLWTLLFLHTEIQTVAQNEAPEVLIHPSSLLVPIDSMAVFECRVQHCGSTCEVHWIINETSTAHPYQMKHFQAEHFEFTSQRNATSEIYTTTLSVPASANVNDTRMCCLIVDASHSSTKSAQAILLVTSGPLLTPNPSATTHNSTQILLEWFPPYLWPGQHISYFNISVINTSDSTATYYRVNSSYSEAIVSLELSLASLEDTCSELVFEISAVVDGLKILRSYTITEKYIPTPEQFSEEDINVTTLFTSAAEPFVTLHIKLPSPVCTSQELNYTIIIDELMANETNSTVYYGIYHRLGSGTSRHNIDSGLERNKEYAARVEATINSYKITSHNIQFSTQFRFSSKTPCPESVVHKGGTDIFYYQLSLGISLSMALLILLILKIILILVCVHKQRQQQQKETGDDRAMVHNPIYDQAGPAYESVIQSFSEFPGSNNKPTMSQPIPVTLIPTTACESEHSAQDRNVPSNGTQNDNYMVMSPFDSPTETQVDERFGAITQL